MPSLHRSDLSPRDAFLGPGSGEELLLSLAPVMFGLIWNWFLLGTLMVQVYYYHLSFPKDHRLLKALVYGVFILDLIQTGLTTQACYYTFVQYFTNANVVNDASKTVMALPLFDGIIAFPVQIFYIWRIRQLGRALLSKTTLIVVLVFIALVSALQAVTAVTAAFSYVFLETHPISRKISELHTILLVWASSGLASDTVIALAMSYLLFKAKDSKVLINGDRLLNRIIARVIATGVLTAFCALITLVVYLRYRATAIYETPLYIIGKLFSNALLVNLNIRSRDGTVRVVDLDTSPKGHDLSVAATNSMVFASTSQFERSGGRVTSTHGSTSIWPPRTEETPTGLPIIAQTNLPEESSHCTDSTCGDKDNTGELHRHISHTVSAV